MNWLNALGQMIGRVLLGAIFVIAGIMKIIHFGEHVQLMASKSMSFIHVSLIGAMLIEIIAGLCLIFGYQAKLAAFLLFLFLIPTTAIFHDFWNLAEPERGVLMIMFLKNLAIMGGLLFIACSGAGKCSIDTFRNRIKEQAGNP